jgi:hypothetical protein
MRFDRFDESSLGDTLIPDGTHECEIVKVKEIVRKSDGQPLTVIEISPADGTYDKFPKYLDPSEKRDHKSAIQLLAALGLPPDSEVDDSLVGRRVQVTTKRGAKKDGEPIVFVNGFSASSTKAEPAPAPAEKRQPRKSASAKTLGDDDIPF